MFLRVSTFVAAVIAFVSCVFLAGATSFQSVHAGPPSPGKLKVYISVDMEGVAGVVTADQLMPAGFEYERFRRFMTNEALAAVRAAKETGATEIVVSDSHGNGENLLIEEFPKEVRIVRSWPRHGGMMAGLDASFDAAMFVGYHASTTNPHGVRAHTFSSAHLAKVSLNGNAVTEGEFNAAYAGSFGVPVIFASGDDAAMGELKSRLGNLETVETKKSLGFHSAETLTPESACEKINASARAALSRMRDFKPYVLRAPIAMEITFKNYTPAEMLSYLRTVERVDSHTIRFVGKDMAEVSDFVEFIDNYSSDLTP
jgi:D-amino peptidase